MLANSRSTSLPVVGQVARPAVGDEHVAVDREDVVVGLPRAGIVGVVQPRLDDRVAADDGLVERVECIADVGAEQVADGRPDR